MIPGSRADRTNALRAEETPMTIEELQAALAETNKRVEALSAKNEELLGEVKTERQKRREAEEARAAADEEARAKAEEAAKASGNAEEIQRTIEARYKGQMEKAQRDAQEATAQLNRYVIDGSIRDALAQAQIAPPLGKAAALLFKDGRNIEVKDGQAFVDGVPIAEAVKEWAGADGAAFKAAGQATGGGAPGGGKSAGKTLADMSEAERMTLARENPEQFRAMRSAAT